MLTDENVTRKPVGWGAYQISEWAPGSRIVLDKNPNYFRAAEGLPYYDQVIYKFILPTPDGNIAAITTGECDIVDVNPALAERLEKLGDEEKAGNLRVLMSQGPRSVSELVSNQRNMMVTRPGAVTRLISQ